MSDSLERAAEVAELRAEIRTLRNAGVEQWEELTAAKAEIEKANDNCVRLEDKFMRREEELLGKLTAERAKSQALVQTLEQATQQSQEGIPAWMHERVVNGLTTVKAERDQFAGELSLLETKSQTLIALLQSLGVQAIVNGQDGHRLVAERINSAIEEYRGGK